ncbi:MAG: ribosomal L7Ae/L30e/S12e/Gadd45 family protein [Candidatus Aenigmarchaeota archaeon]|nr:ribosomal L7Ae/L30e/S12e/Gadd45 family protein [Candidatus Aenigmarchaeota archaeon]MCX8190920.1 ribosomal L7Ae/L30e/S12e/Gadd45 family protein [Candidatus Aenigmarchaeota archaeon]MDW8160113.1 ribosomal L7Ae/L30e/S12e/Gadd45 family protein [Candidatus Aenigmarchaeota archaeon]
MNVKEKIKEALKENKAILGYREVLKFIRNNNVELVVLAKNTPEKIKNIILHSNVAVEIFDGSSKEMGTLCGKPYPVAVIAIKG